MPAAVSHSSVIEQSVSTLTGIGLDAQSHLYNHLWHQRVACSSILQGHRLDGHETRSRVVLQQFHVLMHLDSFMSSCILTRSMSYSLNFSERSERSDWTAALPLEGYLVFLRPARIAWLLMDLDNFGGFPSPAPTATNLYRGISNWLLDF